jgi:branched-chain amino acid transport system substrate-binding protein
MKCQFPKFPSFAGLATAAALVLVAFGLVAPAQAAQPIKIAVLASPSITPGKAIINGAKLAEKDINDNGGVDGRPVKLLFYDTKLSSTGAVNAFKKAVEQDEVVAVTGMFLSEASMPIMPYAKRLNVPLILDSGTTQIGKMIHNHFKRYENVFQLQLNSYYIAQEVCDAAHDLFAEGHEGKVPAVIMSEQADWSGPLDKAYQKCLPKAGVDVKKTVTYSVKTKDYGPVYSEIESQKPELIITGMAHTGLTPVVQWHQKRVPAMMMGFNMQAGTNGFWKASNGAAQGTIIVTNGAGGAKVTPKTPAFYKAYKKNFNKEPMLEAYTGYDSVLAIAHAIKKAGSTDTDKIVKQLENLDMVGVTGNVEFYGKDARFAHVLKYGPKLVHGVAFQWQDGKQVVVWPKDIAQGKLEIPDFVSGK